MGALRACSILLVMVSMTVAYEAYTFEGYGFYYYKDSYNDSTACHARDGIWRVDLATGEEQQIFGDNSGRYLISRCDLSYHGKQLIFHGASIGNGVVNNDGTGYEKLPAELPNSAAGVYLIRVIGVRHGSGSVLRCVTLHR